MRYLPEAKLVQAEIRKNKSSPVVLVPGSNIEGVEGISYAVECNGVKVAYIRNKDIPELLSFVRKYVTDPKVRIHGYCVDVVQENYWVLKNDPGSETLDVYDSAKKKIHEYINKPIEGYFDLTEYNVRTPFDNKTYPTKQETKMNTNSMRDSFFREVKNVAIDIQSGKFGVISQDGISVYNAGTVEVNPIQELGVKVPAFAIRVPVDQLAEGDIILSGADATFFKAKTEQGYEVVTLSGEVKQVGQVSNMFFGKNTVLAVKNMFGSAGGMNPMMLAMLMGDGEFAKGDNKNLMLAMAMSGGMGGSEGMGGMNPLMLMMLLK